MEDIKFEFEPIDPNNNLMALAESEFIDDEVYKSNAFSGAEIIILLLAARETIFRALRFYNKHRESLKDASITIENDSFSMKGYSPEEINQMIESGNVERIIKSFRKGNAK